MGGITVDPRGITEARRALELELWPYIDALSPPDKLRLAADLLERGRHETAYAIADRVVKELGAAQLMARMAQEPKRRP